MSFNNSLRLFCISRKTDKMINLQINFKFLLLEKRGVGIRYKGKQGIYLQVSIQ